MSKLFRSMPISIRLDEKVSETHLPIAKECQLMRTGTFKFGDQGDLTITPEMFTKMISNFKANVRGVDLAIDYKHDSDDIAAGWIKDLYTMNEGTELWAKVDWTPKGKHVLNDKEFRYLSADFHLNFKGNEDNKEYGPTLFGAGLTNRPFIKEMEPVVTLSEKPKGKQMDEKDKQIADLQSQVAALKKQIEDEAAKEGDDSQPNLADVQKENADMKAQCADMQKKLDAFQASAADAEKAKVLAEKKAAFDGLMVAGKAVEAQREAFMSGDTMKFAESFSQVNLSGAGSSNEPPVPIAALSVHAAQDEVFKLAEKAIADKRAKTIGEAQSLILKENPELVKKIYG